MLVRDIPSVIDTRGEQIFDASLSAIRVDEDHVEVGDDQYPLDEVTVRSLGNLLDISNSYLKKCPKDLMAENINYWLRRKSETDTTVHLLNGQPRFLQANTKIIPLHGVVDIIQKIFPESDEVAEFKATDQLVHIDVISSEQRIEVPGRDVPLRPDNDVTHGGIRFRIPADYKVVKPPEVYSYLNRRVCTNGMCISDAQHKLTLRGRDIVGVLSDMESAARDLFDQLPETLATYRSTADREVPGEVTQFVHQIGQEFSIGARVLNKAIERVGEIPAPASLYDVIQLFTNIANDENMTYRTRDSLQTLGGSLAARPEEMTHRCTQCDRKL